MDKGAHFHKCDFQVHTPRDRRWTGPEAITDSERKGLAERYVLACRRKGLHAIAITDHHDTAFFSYIKDAAAAELRDDGTPVPDDDRLVVFPGIELTLGVPCQAILLLDASFPANMLDSVITILGVQPSDKAESRTCETQRLDHHQSLLALCDLLDQNDSIRSRYILLPNISEGGNATLLRSGFAGKYTEMPCVGGYLDGNHTQLGTGNLTIINGKNREYGFKPVGVFQTSDNRRDDFVDLGRDATWVKWAEPTAEALRQACLARATRISQQEPILPEVVIKSLEVSNSKFMGPIDIEFNPAFNCLIGGRGTGKSTVLEYLRWGLCDQPPAESAADDLPDYQTKRQNLITNTLVPLDAVVTVTFLLNGVPHAVRRNVRTSETLLRIAEGPFQPTTIETVRRLLPIQAYSQKQLSAVSVRSEELIRFVRAGLQDELNAFAHAESQLKDMIRTSYGALTSKRTAQKEIDKLTIEIRSSETRIAALRSQLTGLSSQDAAVLKDHEGYSREAACLTSIDGKVARLRELITEFRRRAKGYADEVTSIEDTPNSALVTRYVDAWKQLTARIAVLAEQFADAVGPEGASSKEMVAVKTEWTAANDAHTAAYEAAKGRATQHQSKLAEITQLEQRIGTLKASLAKLTEEIAVLGSPDSAFGQARQQWCDLYRRRGDLLEQRCGELTALSEGTISAMLLRGQGLKTVQERFEGLLSGTRIRAKKVEDLCGQMIESGRTVEVWQQVLDELEKLAQHEAEDGSEGKLPDTPLLLKAGFTATDLVKIAQQLSVEEWLDLALTTLEDIPSFQYRLREGDFIKFADGSAGQQATALLRVLLNQNGPPLIIDQPEEDLDNQVILEIVQSIWSAKPKRQLVFSSHNANVVVNGDADLVICCDYRRAGDQSGGQIKCQGAIDVGTIRKEITTVMEGGREAFALRRAKYGF